MKKQIQNVSHSVHDIRCPHKIEIWNKNDLECNSG